MIDFVPDVLTHVRQPNDYTCACAVVAMLTGRELDDVIAELRPTPKRGTTHRRMIDALKAHGVRCGDRFVSLRNRPLPHTAIVRMIYDDAAYGHVAIKVGGTWYDPSLSCPVPGHALLTFTVRGKYYNGRARLLSSLEVEVGA